MNHPLALGDQGKTAKFRTIEDILKNPALKSKLNNLVDEAVRCKQAIYMQQMTIKDLRETARDDVGINPKQFNAYVAATFNNDYTARRESHMEMVDLLDAVIGLLPAGDSNYRSE